MDGSLFRSLDSEAIAIDIRIAQHSVCYAAPGIQQESAKAMADVAGRTGPDLIALCLNFDECASVLPEAFEPHRSVEAFDIGIVRWFVGLHRFKYDAV